MPLVSKLITTNHGFFTRVGNEGGVDFVRQNLGAKNLITAKQIHSNIAIYVSAEGAYEADALITDKPGLGVGVFTADCAPLLLYDKNAGLAGAVHAGWKGARYGIIDSAVNLMKKMGAKNIVASIGPCIHQKSYEVDINFMDNFTRESKDNQIFFIASKNAGHFMFNLPAYIEDKLKLNHVEKIEILHEDTLTQPDKFFSYRRCTLSGIRENGRQISAISL